MSTLAEPDRDTEFVKILRWRSIYARELGYDDVDVSVLAGSEADLHKLEQLLLAGCDPDLALEIVV